MVALFCGHCDNASFNYFNSASLSHRIGEWVCFFLFLFSSICQENGPLMLSLKCSRSVWERKMVSFSKCFVPVPFGPFLCFWQNQFLQSKLLCFPAVNKWENTSSLWAHSLLWRRWWIQCPEPCVSSSWQEFPGIIPNPELLLPWQNCLLDLRPTRKIALVYEIILRKVMQTGEQVKSFKFCKAKLIAAAHGCAPLLQITTAGNCAE